MSAKVCFVLLSLAVYSRLTHSALVPLFPSSHVIAFRYAYVPFAK